MEAVHLRHFFFAIALHQRGQLSLSLRCGNARFHPAQQIIIVAAAIAWIRWIQSQSGPDLSGVLLARRKLKALRHYADDGAFQAIEVSFAADDVGITRENA